MNRKFYLQSIGAGIAILFAATLLAQTSPWPFASPSGSKSGGKTITAAFWNVEWFPGRRPNASKSEEESQISAVHKDIKELNADIIGLEEVRDFGKASLAVQPLAGFKVDVCANFPPREGQNEAQEVAIASRLQPISAWAEEWKPAGAVTPPRGFAFAAYQVAPQQMVLVYAVHLKSNRGEIGENVPMRQESIRQLSSHMEAMEKAYGGLGALAWIVGGDFNTSPDDPHYAAETTIKTLLEKGFAWSWKGMPANSHNTMPANKGFAATCFDHIFYRGGTMQRATVINTSSQSSDHRPVVATFDLPAGAK
jgi:endonuclease/exonuclease/phosphatase family metal-dependent hydrolase